MIDKELRRIDRVASEAWGYVCAGDYRKARRTIRKIENSFCISESTRACVLINAEIYSAKGEHEEAARLIKSNIGYLWGVYDGWEILSRQNPAVDADSRMYVLKLRGDIALGAFTFFSRDYVTTFEVIANSEQEALGWLRDFSMYADWEQVMVVSCAVEDIPTKDIVKRGILGSGPFSRAVHEETSTVMLG